MLQFIFLLLFSVLIALGISACTSRTDYAPVSDASTIEALPKSGTYHVAAGETLYSIAWRYGLDYRVIAQRNHLAQPYHVQTGQTIYLTQNKPVPRPAPNPTNSITRAAIQLATVTPHTISKPKPNTLKPLYEQEPNATLSAWSWPAQGQVIGAYSTANKGINIRGYPGDPVYATATGKVVYSGHGLRGYGNLIIIKHNSKFLSAYAHNRKVLVKEGDWVKNGQRIAEMGNTGTQRTLLHFEIRRNGQPVNPLMYLTRKV